jgi:hypothetical protein
MMITIQDFQDYKKEVEAEIEKKSEVLTEARQDLDSWKSELRRVEEIIDALIDEKKIKSEV